MFFFLASPPAHGSGAEERYEIRIPALSADIALRELAVQAATQVLFPYDLVKNVQTKPVSGRYTRKEALEKLLQGTGLASAVSRGGIITIAPNQSGQLTAGEHDDMSVKKEDGLLTAFALLVAAGIVPHIASAQDEIQEVIITAQKRSESLQNTPIAISTLSSTTLEQRGITDFTGVAQATPSINFTVYPSSSSTLIMYLRGQGVADPAQITQDGSVGLYQDGFYIARPQFVTFDLADIDRVEVLRGPQGTLYGRNTTGGAINLISRKPSGEFGLKQQIDAGNRGYFRALTSLDLPRWNAVSVKLTALASTKGGWVENSGPSNDYGVNKQRAGRLALHWEGEGLFSADYFFETARAESTPIYYQSPSLDGVVPGYSGAGRPESDTWRPIDLPLSHNHFSMNGLTLSWRVSDSLTINSLTGYRGSSNSNYQDYADSFSNPAYGGATTRFTNQDDYKAHQFTQELQAVGDALDNRVKYVGGLYYFREGGRHFNEINIAIPAFGFTEKDNRYVSANARSRAAYGQVTWTPSFDRDRWSLTLGGRYTKDEKSASRELSVMVPNGNVVASEQGVSNAQSFSRFDPAFTAAYRWSEDLNAYLRVATGYKAGGSTESAEFGKFNQTFGPEKVRTYELGAKSYWWARRLRLNAAIFKSEFKDLQLAFGSNPNNLGVGTGINAGKASVGGVELEALLVPIDDLVVSLSYSYLDPQIDEVVPPAGTVFDPAVNPASPYQVGENIAEIFAIPYAPKHAANVGVDYTLLRFASGDASIHMDYRWQDASFNTSKTGSALPGRDFCAIPAYGVLNGRLTWVPNSDGRGKLRVSLWGKNLTQKKYLQHTIGLGNFVATPSQGAGYTRSAVSWGEPRSYGVSATYEYGR